MRKILLIALVACCFSARAQDIDVLHYRFWIEVTDNNDTIRGAARIKFVLNKASQVSFDLKAIDHSGKGMQVVRAYTSSPEPYTIQFKQESEKLIFTELKAKKGDTVTATIQYKGIPADGLIVAKNKYRDRTFFADNWPNRAHHWIPCVDKPDDKASFEFVVKAPSHYGVISNGIKIEEKEEGNGMKLTHWKEDTPLSTKVMVIGVAKFATKFYDDSPKDIPVTAWMYPQDSAKGFYDYAVAPSILKFFSETIGPFPYKKLANVQSKTIFGGMENASCIFYNEDYVTGKRQHEDVIAHEIAHQWFGDMVSEKSFAHLWLSEGFSDYFEHYYFEKKYGEEAAREKWVEAREQVIAFARQSTRPVVDSTEDLMSLLNANSYKKGAWVLRMLRNEVGDKTFLNIVRAYYEQYKGSNAETKDFEAVAEKVSGKELTWFFEQWLHKPAIPVLELSTKIQNNEFFLYVDQQGVPYRFNLEVAIVEEDGEIRKEIFHVQNKESEFKVKVKGSSAKYSIDPDVKLLYRTKK